MTLFGDVREQTAGSGAALEAGEDSPAKQAAETIVNWFAKVPWCWPALLALALGCYQLGRPELWRDEVSSWSFASRPLSSLFTAVDGSTGATQVPYYLLLHFWIAAFGDSVDAMRLLSVLAMTGAAACVTLVGRRLAGARAGLLSGLLFALVPSVSRFAQEVRFYALEVLVATLATLLLLRALDRPCLRRWAAYSGCLALLGYIDMVALSVIAGHAAGTAVRWSADRDRRYLGFGLAVAAALAACVPLAVLGADQARAQVGWIVRPGVDLASFALFGRNLFYSTSVAAALIVLAVLAWAVAWRQAAFMTAVAVAPVAAVWLVSQGPYSYFFPRYLLLTVGAWAILAGIGLSRLDVRVAVASVAVIAILGAGDQQVIREPGAHNWPSYPTGVGGSYPDYAGAAATIARGLKAGDGILYRAQQGSEKWVMIAQGVGYYLEHDVRPGVPLPRQLFIAETAIQAGSLFPVPCADPAACAGQEPRIWIVGGGHLKSPYKTLPAAQVALLRPRYRVSYLKHVAGLTVFLLTRTPALAGTSAHAGTSAPARASLSGPHAPRPVPVNGF